MFLGRRLQDAQTSSSDDGDRSHDGDDDDERPDRRLTSRIQSRARKTSAFEGVLVNVVRVRMVGDALRLLMMAEEVPFARRCVVYDGREGFVIKGPTEMKKER